MYKLHLTGNQVYSAVLPLESGGRALRLEFLYNRFGDIWSMSLYDTAEDRYVISHVPLLLSQDDDVIIGLLKQQQYIGVGDFVVLMKERGATENNPSYRNFVEDFDLFWGEV